MIYANSRRKVPILGSVSWGKIRWSGDKLSTVTGKRVLVLVHGIRETEARLGGVYSEILSRAVASHDVGVGYVWPAGSTIPLTWPLTVATAVVPSAQRLRDVILRIAEFNPAALDLNVHSLGAAVASKAMIQSGEPPSYIRNVYLMAPAIGQDDLVRFRGVRGRVHVCYNRRDPALLAYRLWPPNNWFSAPVGAIGPSGVNGEWCIGHDYTELIGRSHGGYKRRSEYYDMLLGRGFLGGYHTTREVAG